jgi:hypothetical protein
MRGISVWVDLQLMAMGQERAGGRLASVAAMSLLSGPHSHFLSTELFTLSSPPPRPPPSTLAILGFDLRAWCPIT